MEKAKEIINNNKNKIIIIIAIIILSGLKQFLMQGFPIVVYASACEDDALMVRLAYNILNGEWLGEYKYNTLTKGPIFPILLALLYKLNLPYIFTTTFLYTISCIIFMVAIRKLVKNEVAFIILFILLLFNPIMYSTDIIQRIYRNALIPSFALLITGGYIAIFLRRNEKTRYSVIWSLLTGISLGMFYYTREDSIWIVPFVAFMTFATIIAKLIKEKKINFELISKIIIVIIPIIILLIVGNLIEIENQRHYGIRVKNILTEGNFALALKAMYAVKPEKDIDCVTITQEKVDRMAEVSPSFATIAPKMHEKIGGYGMLDRKPDDSEVEDGWILWTIRTAVIESGYTSIEAEQDIYLRIANELNDAMNKGLLEKQNIMPTTMMSPFKNRYIPGFFEAFFKSIKFIATCDYLKISSTDLSTRSLGEFPEIKKFENISRERALYPEGNVDGKEIKIDGQKEYIDSLKTKTNILNRIIDIYSIINVIIGIVGIIYYIMLTIKVIKELFNKNYESIEKWVIISGILGALFTLIAGIAYNHVATCYSIIYLYLCGTYSLYLAFSGICTYNAISNLLKKNFYNKKEESL